MLSFKGNVDDEIDDYTQAPKWLGGYNDFPPN